MSLMVFGANKYRQGRQMVPCCVHLPGMLYAVLREKIIFNYTST